MYLWIDKNSGTWGQVDGELVVIDADIAGQHMDSEGDEWTCVATLENASDSEIIEIAEHALHYGYATVIE